MAFCVWDIEKITVCKTKQKKNYEKGRFFLLIKLDGKPYKLVYDYNSMVVIEDQLGMSVSEMLSINKHKLGYKAIRSFLYAGLRVNYPELDENDTGDLIYKEVKGKDKRLGELVKQMFTCMKQDGMLAENENQELQEEDGYMDREKKI